MDKIYSRKRFKIFHTSDFKTEGKDIKHKRIKKTIIILIVAMITAFLVIHELNPVFDSICREKAKAISTEIINLESSKVFDGIEYDDLVDVVKDSSR